MTASDTVLQSEERRGLAAPSLLWGYALSGTMALGILSGGSSEASSFAFQLFRLCAILLMAAGLLRLTRERLSVAQRAGVLLATAAVALVAFQLIPLPYGLVSALPGRDFMVKAFAVAGVTPSWMPLTLSPEATKFCLLALLPPLALFTATLTASSRARWMLVAAILFGAVANTFLGLAQRFQGPQSGLYLFEVVNFGSATGFFSNRNNFAMLLCVAIPLTWAMSHKLLKRSHSAAPLAISAGVAMMIVIFMGLAASNSRSGILLGMLALLLSTLMVWSAGSTKSSRRSSRGKYSALALLGGALIIGQFGMVGILRIVETDPLTEYRGKISETTFQTATEYFPWGSGFGSFRPIYGMNETPANMTSAYVNHAHNDWLELWLEGGLPAAALMACFLALYLYQAARLWNPGGNYTGAVLQRAASVVVLVLMIHSLVEFPLRMPALAALFGAMLAIMLTPSQHDPHYSSRRKSHSKRRSPHVEEPLPRSEDAANAEAPPTFKVSRAEGETLRRTTEGDIFPRQDRQ